MVGAEVRTMLAPAAQELMAADGSYGGVGKKGQEEWHLLEPRIACFRRCIARGGRLFCS
jgi:hypothetical protein